MKNKTPYGHIKKISRNNPKNSRSWSRSFRTHYLDKETYFADLDFLLDAMIFYKERFGVRFWACDSPFILVKCWIADTGRMFAISFANLRRSRITIKMAERIINGLTKI